MNIANYIDSTYLKTTEETGISEEATLSILKNLTQEAIDFGIYAVMIRPKYVAEIRKMIDENNSNVVLGTVIGFHEGTYSIYEKLNEAKQAIEDGADELDFVINYTAFLEGKKELIKSEFVECTQLCLQHGKVAKWIIEIAALSNEQIAEITSSIALWSIGSFEKEKHSSIFIKSSTGFYKTKNNKPNGATFEGIKIMLNNANGLPIKAAGGVRTSEEAKKMIDLGVKRIGTSSAISLINDQTNSDNY